MPLRLLQALEMASQRPWPAFKRYDGSAGGVERIRVLTDSIVRQMTLAAIEAEADGDP